MCQHRADCSEGQWLGNFDILSLLNSFGFLLPCLTFPCCVAHALGMLHRFVVLIFLRRRNTTNYILVFIHLYIRLCGPEPLIGTGFESGAIEAGARCGCYCLESCAD